MFEAHRIRLGTHVRAWAPMPVLAQIWLCLGAPVCRLVEAHQTGRETTALLASQSRGIRTRGRTGGKRDEDNTERQRQRQTDKQTNRQRERRERERERSKWERGQHGISLVQQHISHLIHANRTFAALGVGTCIFVGVHASGVGTVSPSCLTQK